MIDRFECLRCHTRFQWPRPQKGGQWKREPRHCPISGIWDPEHGKVRGGDPSCKGCPSCGHSYYVRLK